MADDTVEPSATSTVGESLELDFKGHSVRALMVDGVPWFALRDIVDALGWPEDTMSQSDAIGFPAWAKVTAGEGYDPEAIERSDELVLLSPIGVFFWGSLVDEWKSQAISAWAKRESRRLCPKPVPGDRNMFLTIVDRADATKALPPYGHRYSGWKSDWEDLKWSNEWMAAEDHNRAVSRARPLRTLGAMSGIRRPLGLAPEPEVAIV